jgi:hypothetical protein
MVINRTEELKRALSTNFPKASCTNGRLSVYSPPGNFGVDFDALMKVLSRVGVHYDTISMMSHQSLDDDYGAVGYVDVVGVADFEYEYDEV